MVKFLTDQDFNARIITQLRHRIPGLDLMSVRDVGLASTPDPFILEWAADYGRVVLTHDINTMKPLAQNRVDADLPMSGLIVVRQQLGVGHAIDSIELIARTTAEGGLEGQIITIGRLSPGFTEG